jgi:hypothetical protein
MKKFTNSGQFKKGDNLGNTNGFKKGQNAWNKGTKGKMPPHCGFQKGHTLNMGKIISETTKEKMRQNAIKQFKTKGHPMLGKKRSEGTREKIRQSRLGNKNPMFGKNRELASNWKGGKTDIKITIRKNYKYRQWRSDVFQRDNFTCQECGARGVYLEAHHCLKRFADILDEYKIKTLEQAYQCEELWNINNGISMCRKCHDKTKTNR